LDEIERFAQHDKTIFTTLDGVQVVIAFTLFPAALLASVVLVVGVFWSAGFLTYVRPALCVADLAVYLVFIMYLESEPQTSVAKAGGKLVAVFSLLSLILILSGAADHPSGVAHVSLADLLAAANALFALMGLILWSAAGRAETPTKALVRAWLLSKKEPHPDLIVHLAYHGSLMQRLVLYSYIRRLQRRA
jgi:hypothetical protein